MIKFVLMSLCFVSLSFNTFARDLTVEYDKLKKDIQTKHDITYSLSMGATLQRASPSGKNTAFQTYIRPFITWNNLNTQYGSGSLNAGYNFVYYPNTDSSELSNNIGVVNSTLGSDDDAAEFNNFYYSWQFPDSFKWLNVNIGQFSIGNFDGFSAAQNARWLFFNDALSGNGSSSYSTAGVGIFAKALVSDDLRFVFGFQDATNTDGKSIKVNHIKDKHYATFAKVSYMPYTIFGLSEISVLAYNQPWVSEQPQTTNGWSLNMAQNFGQKYNVFVSLNGVSGRVEEIKNSYKIGFIWFNPLKRNSLDQIGLAYAYNDINEKAVGKTLVHDAEQVIEAYWAWGVSKYMTITPDFQFYINPALNQKSDYAAAFALRLTLSL